MLTNKLLPYEIFEEFGPTYGSISSYENKDAMFVYDSDTKHLIIYHKQNSDFKYIGKVKRLSIYNIDKKEANNIISKLKDVIFVDMFAHLKGLRVKFETKTQKDIDNEE